MSRIGKKPIAIPKGVKVDVVSGAVDVQGPKGKLRQPLPAGIGFEVSGDQLQARTLREDPELGKFHGLARSLVANAVRGVTEGFRKDLDIVGVGYRAEVKGKQVHFALGYSHPVVFEIPTGIDIAIDKQTHVTVTGIDRQLVGQVAANIRSFASPTLQAEGRALHRRSAQEEGRQDGREIAPSFQLASFQLPVPAGGRSRRLVAKAGSW